MCVGLLQDELFEDHKDPSYPHPESPERLMAIRQELAERGLSDQSVAREPRAATRAEITRVHTPAYFDRLQGEMPGGQGHLDPDTYFSEGSWEAALGAAGGALDLTLDIYRGQDELTAGIALVRPPGHHAEADSAMGFCIFNNVAIAAEAARAAGAAKVAVLDWDVHHGNGTQHSFYDRNDVLYLSSHRYPFYPGTGSHREQGKGKGEGYTVNVPLPGGCGDAEYLAAFDQIFLPVLAQFSPDLILLSAGFDAHESDPLGGMGVTDRGYRLLANRMRQAAQTSCGGKLSVLLEGGYNVQAQARGVASLLACLLAEDEATAQALAGDAPAAACHPKVQDLLDEIKGSFAGRWKL